MSRRNYFALAAMTLAVALAKTVFAAGGPAGSAPRQVLSVRTERVFSHSFRPALPAAARTTSGVPTAIQVYARSMKADASYSYQGHRITTYWRTGRTIRVLELHRSPLWRRIDYLSPDSIRGRIIVSNGRQEWHYYPGSKELHHYLLSSQPDPHADMPKTYAQLRANYILSFLPTPTTIADRKVFVLSITRGREGTLARRLWIDAATGLELKREVYSERGALSVTVAFTDIDFHPMFTAASFAVPGMRQDNSGVKLVELHPGPERPIDLRLAAKQLGPGALVPTRLDRLRLASAALVTSQRGKPILHLRYTDGLVLISVFEMVRTQPKRPTRVPTSMAPTVIAGRPAHITHHASLVTLNWDTPTLNITMMGEVAISRMIELAKDFGS